MAAIKTVLFVAELAWVSLVALPPQPVSSARDLTALLVLALPRALSLYDLGLGELVRSVIVTSDRIPNSQAHSFHKLRSPDPLEEGIHRIVGEFGEQPYCAGWQAS